MPWPGSWDFWAPVLARPLTHAVTFLSFPRSTVSPLNNGSDTVILRHSAPMPLILASLLNPQRLCTAGLPPSSTGSRRRTHKSVQGSRLTAVREPSGSTRHSQQVAPQPLEGERKGDGGVQKERTPPQEPQHPPVSLTSAPWRWEGQELPAPLPAQKALSQGEFLAQGHRVSQSPWTGIWVG